MVQALRTTCKCSKGERERCGKVLAEFFQLELSKVALNLIFVTRIGNWELYLSCVEEVLS